MYGWKEVKSMLKLIQGHWYKTKRTPLRLMLLVLPILYSVLLFLYYSVSSTSNGNTENEYRYFFLGLGLAVQFVASIVAVLLVRLDRNAGNFGNELKLGISRNKLIVSKLLLLFFMLFGVELMATTAFSWLQGAFRGSWLSWQELALYSFYGILLMLPFIVTYTWLAYRFDFTGTLIISVLFFLVGVLMGTTNLGGNLWFFIPPTWLARTIFGLLPAAYWLTGTAQDIAGKMLLQLIPLTIVLVVVLLVLFFIWYNNWEGTRKLEE